MDKAISRDGTTIAYERSGSGPALVLVDGALCQRAMGPARPLAKLLSEHFTVYAYDRRGRGDSEDTAPYHPVREVEDLEAVIAEAGGEAYVFGQSSGAALAVEAAHRGVPIRKLALYEMPCIVDDSIESVPDDYDAQLEAMVTAGRRGDAVKSFMKRVGVPRIAIAVMRLLPIWKKLTGVAHTLPYDFRVLHGSQTGRPLPEGRWSGVTAPTLVLDGGKSPAWMRNGNQALAEAVPGAVYGTLPGQTHMLKPEAVVSTLREFFTD
ncbi:MAG: alpha/beta fold hydrolase [Micromonosporaceae bacterium]